MRSLKIADIERYSDLEKNTLEIEQALTYQIDTCSFSIKGEQPTEGEESHPSRVRGLKRSRVSRLVPGYGRTPRGCVD